MSGNINSYLYVKLLKFFKISAARMVLYSTICLNLPYSNQIDETLTAKDIPNKKDFYIKLRLNIKILINPIKDTHENIDYLLKDFGDKSFSLAVDKLHTEEVSRNLKDKY